MRDDYEKHFQADVGENAVKILFTSLAELNPVTSAMSKAYNQFMDEKRWRYVEEFFKDVKKNMEDNEERLHELYDRTDPDENLHLMFIAIDKVKFEYQEARRKEYAKLFVNSILLGNQINFDEKRMFIQLFDELSDADISFLGEFFRKSATNINGIPLEIFRSRLAEIAPLLARLESKGLIFEIFDGVDGGGASDWDESITNFDSQWRNKLYDFTPVGVKFCRFLCGDQ